MDFKVFFITFGVVFLAELGDKTQLTALALTTANKGGAVSVFLGSALALAATSAIAVFGGEIISRYIPEKWLNLSSAILFIIIGICLLVMQLSSKAGNQ